MDNQPFVIERTYDATPEQVWHAITDIEAMKQWYFDMPKFKPVVGTHFDFTGENEGRKFVHLCQVTEVIPNKILSHTWTYEGHPGSSLLTWEIFPEGNGTRVKLTHAGLETFGDQGDYAKKNFEAGWTEILGKSLKEHLENVNE